MSNSVGGLQNQAYDENISQNAAQEPSQGHIYENYTSNSAESSTVENDSSPKINRKDRLLKFGKGFKYDMNHIECLTYELFKGIISMSLIAIGFIGAFIWSMMKIKKSKQPSMFNDICVKSNGVTESIISLKANFVVDWRMTLSEEEKFGILCQHVKSNKKFAGNINH